MDLIMRNLAWIFPLELFSISQRAVNDFHIHTYTENINIPKWHFAMLHADSTDARNENCN